MEKFVYDLGDVVELKKEHHCANRSKLWKIKRMGVDIKIIIAATLKKGPNGIILSFLLKST